MLKISKVEPGNRVVTLRLEGRIVGPWVAELHRSCEEVLAEGCPLRLHVADVEFMDADGLSLLGELRSRGAAIVDPPPFVTEQLKVTDGLH